MSNREEALRQIFEATRVSGRLTEDQKRELLTHLQDAVEAKVGAGIPEMDAVGQAFADLGDLEKIARQFPGPGPAAVTPEGGRVIPDGGVHAWMSVSFLVFFIVMGWFVVPRFTEIFRQVRVPLPSLTLFFLNLTDALRSAAGLAGLALLIVGIFIAWLRRVRLPRAVTIALMLGSVGLSVGLVICLFLPLLSLLEGIGRR
ncbi:MAG TPA: permease prefix domain 1-containing protein [Planctomycetota bacterium]|nr:permease prefix domain 1-containing protein [Planctomycetota bacterium]